MGEEIRPQPSSFSWASCGVVALIFLAIAAIAVPNLIEARKHGGEATPLGALMTIHIAQQLFREGDKEGDGRPDYATLAELSAATLVDGVLGAGTKQGYLFRVWPSAADPTRAWFATCEPVTPDSTPGNRSFCVNQEGVVYYRADRPFRPEEIGPDCAIPHDPAVRRIGQ